MAGASRVFPLVGSGVLALSLLGCGGGGGGDPTPRITVTSPDGGETWLVGTMETVTWSSEGFVSDVSIELSADGGTSWSALVASTANDGLEDVTVPDAPGAQCLVRVKETDGEPSDDSDGQFTIEPAPELTVLSPNGAEVWVEGESHDITWTTEGTVGTVDIHCSTDGGGTWNEVALGETNDGTCAWAAPHEDSASCIVRVQEQDGDPTDVSDAAFTIQYAPLIRVVSPNGREWWAFGETREIKWVNEGTVGNVDIYYSTNYGFDWIPIASDETNTGSYSWDVPSVDSSSCVVRVEETDQDPTDDSDVLFFINPLPPLFSDADAGLAGVGFCGLGWGDYDDDGDLDLALAGWGGSVGSTASKVYSNDAATFADIGAGLTGLEACSLAWGDYDNDGDVDLVLAGCWSDGSFTYLEGTLYDNDGGVLTDIEAELTGVCRSHVAWGDYDNDGDLDLALAGATSYSSPYGPVSKVYRNDGGTFSEVGAGLADVCFCSLAWGDYDNDGDLDLALAGRENGGGAVSKICENEGGVFTDIDAGLPGVDHCSLAWGDYDSDGDLDLALAGTFVSRIYRNDVGTFTNTAAGLEGVADCSLAWGDYDNDGDLDLALAGDGSSEICKIYRNDAGTFTDSGAALMGVCFCSVAWGDCDSDGDLDLAVAGYNAPFNHYSSRIYLNNGGASNTPPISPTVLSTAVGSGEVTFSWNAADDDKTPPAGLSYDLRVGTTSGGDEVFSGMADAGTGLRRIPALGNAQENLSWTLILPSGTYYWSVQAVDTAFCGSPWAPEETVTVP